MHIKQDCIWDCPNWDPLIMYETNLSFIDNSYLILDYSFPDRVTNYKDIKSKRPLDNQSNMQILNSILNESQVNKCFICSVSPKKHQNQKSTDCCSDAIVLTWNMKTMAFGIIYFKGSCVC